MNSSHNQNNQKEQKSTASQLSLELLRNPLGLANDLINLVREAQISFVSDENERKEEKDTPLEMSEIMQTASAIRSASNVSVCNSSMKRSIMHSARAAYRLHLGNLPHSNISSIRVYEFESFNPRAVMLMMKADLNYYISISMKNGLKAKFIIKNKSELANPDLINNLIASISESCLEVVVPKSFRRLSRPLQSSSWATMYSSGPSDVTQYYIDINDPIMMNAIRQCGLLQNSITPLILDVGAGRGRLAEQVLTFLTENNIACHYVLLEPSLTELTRARERLTKLFSGSQSLHQISYVNGLACTDTLSSYRGRANLILSSGGPLNDQIVDLNTARSVAALLFESLAADGMLISTGLTFNLLTAKAFRALGFSVDRMVSRHTSESKSSSSDSSDQNSQQNEILQCYVLSKPLVSLIPSERDELPAGLSQAAMDEGIRALDRALQGRELPRVKF